MFMLLHTGLTLCLIQISSKKEHAEGLFHHSVAAISGTNAAEAVNVLINELRKKLTT